AQQMIDATKRKLAPLKSARRFIDSLYSPAKEFLVPTDETIVCRCEEVTAKDIRHYVDLGCTGPNQTKSFGRPGMGPCQGRYCGLTVSELIADQRGVPVADVGYYRIRPPIKPVTIAELASLHDGE
ncbi:MAG: (2Fe-2S)-binding protein, partial [Gammaproteobacteria bacterium]|nr:(2Fe-2S)-binding protein [Gammaproteobacteria bacterium]